MREMLFVPVFVPVWIAFCGLGRVILVFLVCAITGSAPQSRIHPHRGHGAFSTRDRASATREECAGGGCLSTRFCLFAPGSASSRRPRAKVGLVSDVPPGVGFSRCRVGVGRCLQSRRAGSRRCGGPLNWRGPGLLPHTRCTTGSGWGLPGWGSPRRGAMGQLPRRASELAPERGGQHASHHAKLSSRIADGRIRILYAPEEGRPKKGDFFTA
jgi:hypothetical protein